MSRTDIRPIPRQGTTGSQRKGPGRGPTDGWVTVGRWWQFHSCASPPACEALHNHGALRCDTPLPHCCSFRVELPGASPAAAPASAHQDRRTAPRQ
jgi:hypothetical protein